MKGKPKKQKITFQPTSLSKREHDYQFPSVCYERELKKVACIGGQATGLVAGRLAARFKQSAELYDLETDQWTALPELQRGRHSASSCFHGDYLFVFGGWGAGDQLENTIERLSKACLLGQADPWELIEPETSELRPRAHSAMVSLNANDYLILGGTATGLTNDVSRSNTLTTF